MFARMMWRSLVERKARAGIAVFAVAVAATTVSAVLHLGGDVRRRMSEEVRAYGPNLVVYPRGEAQPLVVGGTRVGEARGRQSMTEADARAVQAALPPAAKSVVVRSGAVTVKGVPCGAISLAWKEAFALCPWWEAQGASEADPRACLIGVDLAAGDRLGVRRGDTIDVDGERLRVAGVLATGGPEDRQVVLTEKLGGKKLPVAAVWARLDGGAAEVEGAAQAVERSVPGVSARPVRQVSEADGKVLDRVGALLLYICLAVLGAAGLCVATTMLATAADREKEMALLVALGAGARRIAILVLSQAALLGAAGGLLGYLFGWQVARLLGGAIFHAPADLAWGPLGPVLASSVALCLLGAVVPLRRALSLAPALVLKGE